jgi:hypothetical protein
MSEAPYAPGDEIRLLKVPAGVEIRTLVGRVEGDRIFPADNGRTRTHGGEWRDYYFPNEVERVVRPRGGLDR